MAHFPQALPPPVTTRQLSVRTGVGWETAETINRITITIIINVEWRGVIDLSWLGELGRDLGKGRVDEGQKGQRSAS